MGMQNCSETEKLPLESKYFFKQMKYDINSGKDIDDMKERCK